MKSAYSIITITAVAAIIGLSGLAFAHGRGMMGYGMMGGGGYGYHMMDDDDYYDHPMWGNRGTQASEADTQKMKSKKKSFACQTYF